MPPRFLADSIDLASSTGHLSADEARHLSQVLRLDTGDEIAVFDGAFSKISRKTAREAVAVARFRFD